LAGTTIDDSRCVGSGSGDVGGGEVAVNGKFVLRIGAV
jgi:hypothetical protein